MKNNNISQSFSRLASRIKNSLSRLSVLASLIFCLSSLQAQDTVRVMHYNLLFYGNCNGVTSTQKDGWLETITTHYQPDILTVNEMSDRISFANRINTRALTYGDMEYTSFTNTTGSSIVNMMFYNKQKFGYKGIERIGNALRDINVYTLYHLNSIQNNDTVFLYCIVGHLKASRDANSASQRAVAAQQIVSWVANHPDVDGNFMMMGDLNLYSASEAAWTNLVRNTNPVRFYDPAGLTTGWNAGNVKFMTQSTRCSGVGDCGVPGCLDDRFDFILPTDAIMSGTDGIAYVQNSYETFGNDGLIPFDANLSDYCSNNTAVPSNVCNALVSMSDHLPVVMELAFLRSNGLSDLIASIPGMKIQPINPFDEQLTWSWKKTNAEPISVTWQVLDAQGKLCFSRTENLQSASGKLSFSTSHLSAGLYLLRAIDESGRQIQQKVVKR